MDTIMDFLSPLLPIIQVILATFAAKYAASFIGEHFGNAIEWLRSLKTRVNQVKYLEIAQFDDWLFDRLISTCEGVYDSYVEAIKAASADGKLTPEEAKDATKKAYEAFIDGLTTVEYKELYTVLGEDVKRVIMARIPAVVASLKGAKRKEEVEEAAAVLEASVKDPQ